MLSRTAVEIRSRAAIAAELQIGRYPGTVTATLAAPEEAHSKVGLLETVRAMYK